MSVFRRFPFAAGALSAVVWVLAPAASMADPGAFDQASPVGENVLTALRGGASGDPALENLQAHLADNTADGSYSGTNTIADGAFAGASGIFNTFQNFGNNVIYQSVINVTVTTQAQ